MIRFMTLQWIGIMPVLILGALLAYFMFKRDFFMILQFLTAVGLLINGAFIAMASGLDLISPTFYQVLSLTHAGLLVWVIFSSQPEKLYKRLEQWLYHQRKGAESI